MDFYSIVPFAATACNLFLAGLVFFRNPKNPIHRSFTLFSAALVMWNLGAFLLFSATSEINAWLAAYVNVVGLVFIPSTFFSFVLKITENKEHRYKIFNKVAFVLSFIFLVTGLFTKYFFAEVQHQEWGWFPRIEWAGLFFLPFLVFFAANGLYILWKARRNSTDIKHNQLSYIFFGCAIGFLGGFLNILVTMASTYYPVGFLFNVLYASLVAYAILAYRLMDVTIIIRKGLSYTILLIIMIGLYLSFGFFYQQQFGSQISVTTTISFLTLATFITVLIISALQKKIESGLGKLLFHGRYDYQKSLQVLSKNIVTIVDFEELTDSVLKDICEIVGTEKGSLMVFDKSNNEFFVKSFLGLSEEAKAIKFNMKEEIIVFMSQDKIIIKDEMFKNPEMKKVIRNKEASMEKLEKLEAYISIPIIYRGVLRGILSLGKKFSGNIYNEEDFRLFSILASSLAVALENAIIFKEQKETMQLLEQSKNQLLEAERTILIGQLSAGIAHEIRNPLTSLMGRIQIMLQDKKLPIEQKQDLEVVEEQAVRINDIAKNLLSFANPSVEKKEINVNVIIERVFYLSLYQKNINSVKIIKQFSPLLSKIYGNAVLLQQMLLNLVYNAMESMDGKGEISLLTNNINEGKQIQIVIRDTGRGMTAQEIEKIFRPFYTTKAEGTGLGLFLVSNIVRIHYGTINIESAPGKGTTFTICFPAINAEIKE